MTRMIHRVCFVVVICAVSASAQWLDYPTPGIPRNAAGKPNLAAPVPRAADGHPDLSGLWLRVRNPNERVTALAMGPNLEDFMRPGEKIPPLLPAAEALHQQRMANFMADRPSAHCLPHSIPDKMLIRIPVKIVQIPGLTLILYEQFTQYRQIFTDRGRFQPFGDKSQYNYGVRRKSSIDRAKQMERIERARRMTPESR